MQLLKFCFREQSKEVAAVSADAREGRRHTSRGSSTVTSWDIVSEPYVAVLLARVFCTHFNTRSPARFSPPHGGTTSRAEPRNTTVLSLRVAAILQHVRRAVVVWESR